MTEIFSAPCRPPHERSPTWDSPLEERPSQMSYRSLRGCTAPFVLPPFGSHFFITHFTDVLLHNGYSFRGAHATFRSIADLLPSRADERS
jgi:hypothetical protein